MKPFVFRNPRVIMETSTHTSPLMRTLEKFSLTRIPREGGGWDAQLVTLTPPASARIASDLHVLIGSVPWRRASLNRLIRDVAYQTLLPGHVHLVLDGTDSPNAELDLSPLVQRGVKILICEQNPARGAGSRWDALNAMKDEHFVCNLDDDVGLISNDYLSWQHLKLHTFDAVCSGGYTPEGRFIMCTKMGIPYDGPINCLQAGAFSARVRVLRGLNQMPMAKEMLGMLGDDEGLIAAHLWKSGVAVYRIDAPVAFDPCGSDPRSQFLNLPGRITRLRTQLRKLTGWPWGNV